MVQVSLIITYCTKSMVFRYKKYHNLVLENTLYKCDTYNALHQNSVIIVHNLRFMLFLFIDHIL